MSIRKLSKELQSIANSELNENPSRINDDLAHIKSWLAKQKHLRARTEDQWLLTFLRHSKFSLERTKERLEFYYGLKVRIPEFFEDRNPFSPAIQEVLNAGIGVPLKKPSDGNPRIFLFRLRMFDPSKILAQDMFKCFLMANDIVTNEDDDTVISGGVALVDFEGMSAVAALHFYPAIVKKLFICLLRGFPNRIKAVHIFNIPKIIEKVLDSFRSFLKEKLQNRIFIHNGNDMSMIHKMISKSELPYEYGGDAGYIQEYIDVWKEKVESYSEWFKEDENMYGMDITKVNDNLEILSDALGTEGSFRKLDLD